MFSPDDLKALIERLVAPFDEVPRPDQEEIREAAVKLEPEMRHSLFRQMHVLLVIAAAYKAALGDGEGDLLGAGADPAQVMNLLCAVDSEKLSIDVIDRLTSEVGHIFGGWTALPRPLFETLCQRMDEQEEAYAEQEEKSALHHAAKTKPVVKH